MLHPKDHEFINNLYLDYFNRRNDNKIFYYITNIVKNNDISDIINLFIETSKYLDTQTSLKIIKFIISKCKINKITKLNITNICHPSIINVVIANNLLEEHYNNSISYYEIICYMKSRYDLDFSSLNISDNIIQNYTKIYLKFLDHTDYISYDNMLIRTKHIAYHINYMNKYNSTLNNDYHLLYIKLFNLTIGIDNNIVVKDIVKYIDKTAKILYNILLEWKSTEKGLIDLTDETYLDKQIEIIEFISNCGTNDLLQLYNNNIEDLPDELLEMTCLFQNELSFLISKNSPLNIYARCKIVQLNVELSSWNFKLNLISLIDLFIELEKYNESTGFDMQDTTRVNILRIIYKNLYTETKTDKLKEIINDDNLRWYKFTIILLMSYNLYYNYLTNLSSKYIHIEPSDAPMLKLMITKN
jgi:hypothetical protein